MLIIECYGYSKKRAEKLCTTTELKNIKPITLRRGLKCGHNTFYINKIFRWCFFYFLYLNYVDTWIIYRVYLKIMNILKS